jgi:hypothetical protein
MEFNQISCELLIFSVANEHAAAMRGLLVSKVVGANKMETKS